MELRIGEIKWKVHFTVHALSDAEIEVVRKQQAEKGYKAIWDVDVRCSVHTGPCIWSHVPPKYCVNGTAATAHCSTKEEHFLRRKGYKTAFGRAIQHLAKEVRTVLWNAYRRQVRDPKENSKKFQERLKKMEKAA